MVKIERMAPPPKLLAMDAVLFKLVIRLKSNFFARPIPVSKDPIFNMLYVLRARSGGQTNPYTQPLAQNALVGRKPNYSALESGLANPPKRRSLF